MRTARRSRKSCASASHWGRACVSKRVRMCLSHRWLLTEQAGPFHYFDFFILVWPKTVKLKATVPWLMKWINKNNAPASFLVFVNSLHRPFVCRIVSSQRLYPPIWFQRCVDLLSDAFGIRFSAAVSPVCPSSLWGKAGMNMNSVSN